ncbi:PP2C family serine/threonine-protein phosphatase [Kutzneria buriramensis]|uniref:Serine/threonine protein phosphatase PrpC n=1 Tax=Kutzneria buriramensis TaxID=1045776 RepID=A0A3E0HKA0_9PSEU|nr:protein phosphatase 2C domain-containing protein [Kutzneria buriramensis]REH46904.1 serine/threonine protein phosphatase PrpC [Kutzneria buriramensis]
MTCTGCGSAVAPSDNFCETCGLGQPTGRDHVEIDLGVAAGVSDRGLVHHRNEDALALRAADNAVFAVVSDGVSTADLADEASLAAVDAAIDVLVAGGPTVKAVAAANSAVAELPIRYDDTAPSCTYVSAAITADEVTIGWVGDSRAYWIGAEEALVLTVDDAHGHALTAWLGADAGEVEPHITTYYPAGPGVVVLCSDGLWNYLGSADELADRVRPLASQPRTAATELVRFAIGRGGHDNVTVVVAPLPSTSTRSDRP